jgi:hypothetical protein
VVKARHYEQRALSSNPITGSGSAFEKLKVVPKGYHYRFFIKTDSDIRNHCQFCKPALLTPFTAGFQPKTDSDILAGALLPQTTTMIGL